MTIRPTAIAFGLVLATLSLNASASWIAPAFNECGLECDGTAGVFVPFTTYLVAHLIGDAAANGVTGAEFRVDGYDAAWFSTVMQNPAANLDSGSPIAGGCNIGFATCQTGTPLILFTIRSIALSPVSARFLRVFAHSTSSDPGFACPLFTLCDAPTLTKFCTTGTSACLNTGVRCCAGDTTCPNVAVTSATWSRVKQLYSER